MRWFTLANEGQSSKFDEHSEKHLQVGRLRVRNVQRFLIMKSTPLMTGVIACGLLLGGSRTFASKNSVVTTAVYSSVSNGYERQKLPDGSFKREYYAIARGHYVPGRDKNASIDGVPFPSIAGLVAEHLAEQNYYLAQDSKSADILLLITWGTTLPFDDIAHTRSENNFIDRLDDLKNLTRYVKPKALNLDGTQSAGDADVQAAEDSLEQQLIILQAANNDRFKASETNAKILGYVDEMNSFGSPARFSGAGSYYDDLTSDLEEERYYVVISAYDFHTAVHDGTRKLLWATRVSISARSNKFDEQLATMLAAAGRQFGKESHHLIRQYREGHIDLGELKFLGVVPDAAGSNQAASQK